MVVAWVFARNVYLLIYYYLESIYNHMVPMHSYSFVSSDHIRRLHKSFCTLRHNQIHVQNIVAQGQPSQANPLNIARYRNLQCTVGAENIGFLLSAEYHSGRFDASKRDTYIRIPCLEFYAYFIVLKLVFKSLALLLEDR